MARKKSKALQKKSIEFMQKDRHVYNTICIMLNGMSGFIKTKSTPEVMAKYNVSKNQVEYGTID